MIIQQLINETSSLETTESRFSKERAEPREGDESIRSQSAQSRSSSNPPMTGSISEKSLPATSQLPRLPYSLREHKLSIIVIWTLLAIDGAILPIALFYPLWYATSLRSAYIFAISTSVFGIISGIEWAFRSWRLWRWKDVRPLNDALAVGGKDGDYDEEEDPYQGKWAFDFFHFMYTIGYAIALVSSEESSTFTQRPQYLYPVPQI